MRKGLITVGALVLWDKCEDTCIWRVFWVQDGDAGIHAMQSTAAYRTEIADLRRNLCDPPASGQALRGTMRRLLSGTVGEWLTVVVLRAPSVRVCRAGDAGVGAAMLWYRDFQFEWVERGCRRTLEHRTQPVTFSLLGSRRTLSATW